MTRTQTLIVILMAVFCCAGLAGLGLFISRTLSQPAPPVTLLPWTPVGGAENGLGVETPPVTLPTPTATPTPTPAPVVATRYDLQVLREPDNLTLRLERGNEYLRLKAYTAALEDFSWANQLAPADPAPLSEMGRALFYMRRWREAELAFQAALNLNGDYAPAHFWLGRMYYYQGLYPQAVQAFDRAAEYAPGDHLTEAWLAQAALLAGDAVEAQAAAMRATVLQNTDPMVLIARARISAAAGDREAAHGALIYAQDLAPHNFDVLHNLALFYLEYWPARIFEAEQLTQQALRWADWDLERAQAQHTLARIYMFQERREAAIEALQQAADLARVDGTPALPTLWADIERYAP